MILVIDAYNVLKAALKAKMITELERRQFVNDVLAYAAHKNHTVAIIFDGGPYPFPFVTALSRGQLVYSGFTMTADDYIRHYLVESKHKDLFLISSDRELIRKARQCNAEYMGGHEFYQKMQEDLDERRTVVSSSTELLKTTEREDPLLDALMIEGAARIERTESIAEREKRKRKAAGNKQSRVERTIQRKRDKL